MQKDRKLVQKRERILEAFKELDRDKIYVLYFSYYLDWHNLYHSPLIVFTKLLGLITRKKPIDHVCHISRFIYDRSRKTFIPKIFEATTALGMGENDLETKLELMYGKVWIEELGNVNKEKAREFENKYRGVPYSMKLARDSGIDILDKKSDSKPKEGGFCSWLVATFLIRQSEKSHQKIMKSVLNKLRQVERGNPLEITPMDLYLADLADKKLFFNSKIK
jgi:hypothetical protein